MEPLCGKRNKTVAKSCHVCSSPPSPACSPSGCCCKDVWSRHSVVAVLHIPFQRMWQNSLWDCKDSDVKSHWKGMSRYAVLMPMKSQSSGVWQLCTAASSIKTLWVKFWPEQPISVWRWSFYNQQRTSLPLQNWYPGIRLKRKETVD